LLGIALEETWQELDRLRRAWTDLQKEQQIKKEFLATEYLKLLASPEQQQQQQQHQHRQHLEGIIPYSVGDTSQQLFESEAPKAGEMIEKTAVETAASTNTIDKVASDVVPTDLVWAIKILLLSLLFSITFAACLILIFGDQRSLHRIANAAMDIQRSLGPALQRYIVLVKDEVSGRLDGKFNTISMLPKIAKTVAARATTSWNEVVEYRFELWSLLTRHHATYRML
ncbi:hypothetical protein BG004_001285, partial [Podila humilis]